MFIDYCPQHNTEICKACNNLYFKKSIERKYRDYGESYQDDNDTDNSLCSECNEIRGFQNVEKFIENIEQ